jgi:mRNA interferase HigB
MRIIAVSTLKAFLGRSPSYAEAHDPIMAWVRQVKNADWSNPAGIKRDIKTASILQDGRAVFNIAGNKYRISYGSTIRIVWSTSGSSARTRNMI